MNIKEIFLLWIFVSVAGLIVFGVSYAQPQEQGLEANEAKSISLKVLSWREATSFKDLNEGSNIDFFLPPIDGFRAGASNFIQRGPAGGNDPETGVNIPISTKYPVKTQFLVVARVPEGTKKVRWCLSNADAKILRTPRGSEFLDGSNAITPVGAGLVEIENVQYAIIKELQLPIDWKDKLDNANHGEFQNFYDVRGTGRYEYTKSFNIAPDESYIIITASRLGETDIVAYALEPETRIAGKARDYEPEEGKARDSEVEAEKAKTAKLDPREASVYATVEWVKQPPPLIPKYNFVANVIDEPDPITVGFEMGNILKLIVSITVGENSAPIPTNLLAFRLKANDPDGWWKGPEHHLWPLTPMLLAPGGNHTVVVDVEVLVPEDAELFKVNNTELRLVGPRIGDASAGYVIITNEPTAVVPPDVAVSGLMAVFLIDGPIQLTNQGMAGAIFNINANVVPAVQEDRLDPGTLMSFDADGVNEVTIEFTIRGRGPGGILVEEVQEVILRR